MKKIIYFLLIVSFLFTTIIIVGCDDDVTPSLYESIPPVSELPVSMYFNFDAKISGVPYSVALDANENVYVSVVSGAGIGLGVKKIVKKPDGKDSLANFAPKGAETFFNSMTFAPNGKIYATRRVRGIVEVSENTVPAAFVTQGIEDNLNDVEYDNLRNIFWSGGNTGILYRVTFDKNVKKFYYLRGNANISAIKPSPNYLFVAFRDTLNQELVWKFPIVSPDSLGEGELFFNFTSSMDTVARINDIAVAEDGEVFVFSSNQGNAITAVRSASSFNKAFSGLIVGAPYTFVWGAENYAYFSNIIAGTNSDIWRINMGKKRAQ